MRLRSAVAVVLFALMSAGSAQAASYYVALTGNDSNNGATSAPFRTLNKAAAIAKPGDVINVRGGVYAGAVTIGSKGTAASRIVFRAYPGETAILDGTGLPSDKAVVTLYRTEYVDFSGFEVRNGSFIGINGYAAKQTRVLNNDVHHSVRNGIYFGYSTFGTSADITIEGNEVHDNVTENRNHATGGGWAAAVVADRSDRVRIANNRIYNNDGEGVIALLSDNVTIEGNEISDNFSVGIYLDNAQFASVQRNLVYSTGNSRYFRDGYPATGIAIANESYSTSNPSTDITITNNIVVDTRWGFYYGNYERGGGLKNTAVVNNTFYKSAQSILAIESAPHANNSVQNNIFYQVGGTGTASYAGGGVMFRNNNWYGGNSGAASGAGDIYGDPLFVNAGGTRANDYKLRPTSVALHTAITLPVVTMDFFGSLRTPSADIGAHELSLSLGSSAPADSTDTVAPSSASELQPVAVTATTATLRWAEAMDNEHVAQYLVFRDGVHVQTVRGTLVTEQQLTPSTTYRYHVVAVDASGNESVASAVVEVTTSAAGKRRAAGK